MPGEVSYSLAELAELLGGEVLGPPDAHLARVRAAANLEDAGPGTIVRVEHPRYLARALATEATAFLLPREHGDVGRPAIRVAGVRPAFFRCLELFSRDEPMLPGVDPTARVAPTAVLADGCYVGPYAVVGPGVRLGPGAQVHAHAVLGEDCSLAEGAVVHPHAVLYPRTELGARSVVHAGCVLGADGYGYEWDGTRHARKPHNGRVVIGEDVEIGANTTIDRATTGETRIGAGTKIDNLVHLGHNVRVGRHCLIVAQVGVAGSAQLGDGVVLAGQVGVNPHVSIGDGTRVGGQSGVWRSLPPGVSVSGIPARPHRDTLRILSAQESLPEVLRRLRELEQRLAALERGQGDTHPEPSTAANSASPPGAGALPAPAPTAPEARAPRPAA